MDFSNGNWTCYYSWPNQLVAQRFHANELSNNHLLTADESIRQPIEEVHPGDLIALDGLLVTYSNPSNSFRRTTSTTRDDTGQGACETIYVESFEIRKRANTLAQGLFTLAKILFIASLLMLILLFFLSPGEVRKP
jgi:hypothetical protein